MSNASALGAELHPMTSTEISAYVRESSDERRFLLNHNLHSLYLFHRERWFRDFYAEADRVVIDGWPVLRAAARGAEVRSAHRVGSTDWIDQLADDVARSGSPFRVWLLGTDPSTNALAQTVLSERTPSLIVGGRDGFFDIDDCESVVREIRHFEPDLVLVGMGMPRQELFLYRNMDALPSATYATVGGAIDYVAGKQRLAPRSLGRLGLEWVWRLANDPRRLAHRYLVEPLKLAGVASRNRLLNKGPWESNV